MANDPLVLIYDQLDEELRDLWDHLAHKDVPPVTVAAARRIVELNAQEICLDILKSNKLLDFAWQCARSSDPLIRAEMLGILLDNRNKGTNSESLAETLIKELVYDDAEIVRAATLYHLLSDTKLQSEFPDRLDAVIKDDTLYAKLIKVIVYTNLAPEAPQILSDEMEKILNITEKFLQNALAFHMSAQSSFLPPVWQNWLAAQLDHGEPETIAVIKASNHFSKDQDRTRPIFEPNWFLNYANGVETVWYQPQKSTFQTSTGFSIIIKKVDELNLIFHLRQQFPDYLEC